MARTDVGLRGLWKYESVGAIIASTQLTDNAWHALLFPNLQMQFWCRGGAQDGNSRDPTYLRTRLGYRVTGKCLESYYILGSRTKLASWTAPGVSLLEARCNAESV